MVERRISNSVKKKPGTKLGAAKDERGRIRDSLCLGVICNLAVAPNACGVAKNYATCLAKLPYCNFS